MLENPLVMLDLVGPQEATDVAVGSIEQGQGRGVAVVHFLKGVAWLAWYLTKR